MTQKQNTHQHLTNLDGRNYRNDNKCTGPQSCMGHTFVGNWSQNNVVSFFYTRLLLQAQCDPVPPMWGYSSIFAAQGKVDRRNRFAQVLASMPDAGPIAPTGLGHWTPLRVPPPRTRCTPDSMGTPQRATSIHTHIFLILFVPEPILLALLAI